MDDVKKLTEKGIPVVTFDSNPDLAQIDGVTLTSQDDKQLAHLALDSMNKQLNGSGNIVYLWVDGFRDGNPQRRIPRLFEGECRH